MAMGVMELLILIISLGILVAAIAGGVYLGIRLSKSRGRDGDARPRGTG